MTDTKASFTYQITLTSETISKLDPKFCHGIYLAILADIRSGKDVAIPAKLLVELEDRAKTKRPRKAKKTP